MRHPNPPSVRVRPRIWIGLVALALYVLLAAGLGSLLDVLLPTDDATAEFAISHLIPLPIAIAAGLLFIRWAGWSRDVWRERPTVQQSPRRLWLLAIPAFMIVLPLTQLPGIPWAERGLGTVVIILMGTILVGFGEELTVRGILLVSVRRHHGELVTLLVTSLAFGAAHVAGSLFAGLPPGAILFQVVFLAMNGSLYYWVRRVTGRLWAAMAIHALTDWVLYLSSGASSAAEALATDGGLPGGTTGVLVVAQTALVVLSALAVVSAALEDRRTRRASRADA